MAVLATDNFNRANANPIGSPWTTSNSESAMQIVSNACTPSSLAADCGAFYSGITWPADQYSKAKITVNGTAGSKAGSRIKVREASGAHTYYNLIVDHAATLNVALEKVVGGVFTTLTGFPVTQAWTDGDTWEIRAIGTTITCYLNGAQVGPAVTDNAIASGSPGVGYSSVETAVSIDDWEGGTIDSVVIPVVDKPLTLLRCTPLGPSNPLREVKYYDYTIASAGISDSVAETLSGADTETTTADFVSSETETLSAADSETAIATFPVSESESLTATDSQSATETTAGAVAESLTATATQTGGLSVSGADTEALTAADSQTGIIAQSAARTESLAASDSETGTLTADGQRAESLSAADTSSVVFSGVGVRSESLAAADALIASVITAASASESLSATDTSTGVIVTLASFTFRFAGGPVLTAHISAGGVLIASVNGGPVLTSSVSGGPA